MKFYKYYLLNKHEKLFDMIDILNKVNIKNNKDIKVIDVQDINKFVNFTYNFESDRKMYYFFDIKSGKNQPNLCRVLTDSYYDTNILNDNVIHTNKQFFMLIYKLQYDNNNYILINNETKATLFFDLLDSLDPLDSFKIGKNNFKMESIYKNEKECIQLFKKSVKELNKVSLRGTNDLFIRNFLNFESGKDWSKLKLEGVELKFDFNGEVKYNTITDFIDSINENIINNGLEYSFEGIDENNNAISINKNVFYNSIIIDKKDIKKDGDGFYDSDDILAKLLNKLKTN
jgi:hypothetical protein